MSIITLNASSTTVILNGYPLSSLSEGDFVEISSPNPLTTRTNSEGGGVTIKKRLDSDVADVVVRVEKLSADDVFLNEMRKSVEPILISGSIKESYSIDGIPSLESYSVDGGSMTDQPTDTKNNQDGNAMMEYKIQFRVAVRNL